ncbi:hypothetical protein C266_17566 [Pandoraea sp. SD6-2]|nr:hypothetical protein C266_17566 [Pandoraea sp. SD6-2]
MTPSARVRTIDRDEATSLRRLLAADWTLDSAVLSQMSWKAIEIDDKALFDGDADRIGAAFRAVGAEHFYVVKVSELLPTSALIRGYEFPSTSAGIEAFQGADWFELNLDDCLLVTSPLRGVVLRPGTVTTTFIAGEKAFIDAASQPGRSASAVYT